MKVIVIGATGTIGAAVAASLAEKHEVIRASRHGEVKVNIDDAASIRAMFESTKGLDAVVCCAGNAAFGALAKLTDDDFALGLRSKLMGQVNVVRFAQQHLRDGGSITLTSGVLSHHPMIGSAAISLVNAGLEGFVRAAALDLPRGLRVNVVSPGWVKETMVRMGMDPATGTAASDVARTYVAAVEGTQQGKCL